MNKNHSLSGIMCSAAGWWKFRPMRPGETQEKTKIGLYLDKTKQNTK